MRLAARFPRFFPAAGCRGGGLTVEDFEAAFDQAMFFFTRLSWSPLDLAGGAVLMLAALAAARAAARAFLVSAIGRGAGSVASLCLEAAVGALVLLKLRENPGAVLAALGWAAAAFRALAARGW
jgi:hypothetical protein